MAWIPRKLGLLLLVYAAVVAYALVSWLPSILEAYDRLAARRPWFGYAYLGAIGLGMALLLGWTLILFYRLGGASLAKRRARDRRAKNPSELSAFDRAAELAENIAASEALLASPETSEELKAELRRQLRELAGKQEAQRLEIVAFGTISSGKSSLLNALAGRQAFASHVVGGTTAQRCEIPWPGADQVTLVDTPGLAEVHGEDRARLTASAAQDADLVLLVIDGPLKAYEVELVAGLCAMEKRVLVCLNKEDWYDERQRSLLLDQIAGQLPQIDRADVTVVRAASSVRRRIRVLADGTEQEESYAASPDVSMLATRMLEVVLKDGRDLLLANLLLRSRGLVDDAKARVRAVLDARAEETIRRAMWVAGGATGANPFPLLDLAGGAAVTLKMTLDLARIYRQPIDAEMATEMLQQLSKTLVASLGGAAGSAAMVSLIGSLLKSVPGVGFVAGGLTQGLVQALITRWIGNVFVEYLRNEMRPPRIGFAETARRQWKELTTADALRKLIHEGRRKLSDAE